MYSSRYRTGEARPRPGEGREDVNTGRECAAGVLGRVARAITCAAPAGTARESAPMVVCAAFDPGPGGSSRLMFGKGTLSLLHSNGSGLHNDVSLVGFAIRGGGSGFVVAPASLADFSWRPSLGASDDESHVVLPAGNVSIRAAIPGHGGRVTGFVAAVEPDFERPVWRAPSPPSTFRAWHVFDTPGPASAARAGASADVRAQGLLRHADSFLRPAKTMSRHRSTGRFDGRAEVDARRRASGSSRDVYNGGS